VNLQPLIPAVIGAIKTQSGRPVGYARKPGTVKEIERAPYAVVYQLYDAVTATSFTDDAPFDMQWVTTQVSCFGEQAEQVAALADSARYAIIGRTDGDWAQTIDPSGLEVCGRVLDATVGVSEESGEWFSADRFRFLVTG
jgi:hypothetical protein